MNAVGSSVPSCAQSCPCPLQQLHPILLLTRIQTPSLRFCLLRRVLWNVGFFVGSVVVIRTFPEWFLYE